MAPIKVMLRLVAVLLLGLAIGLQVTMRKRTHLLLERSGSNDNIGSGTNNAMMLQDFLIDSAELKKFDKTTEDDLMTTNMTIVTTPNNNNNNNNNNNINNIVVNITSLGCIDLVRRCMRFKEEKRPLVIKKATKTTTVGSSTNRSTLALAAPVLKGGYRNQYMRFVGLVAQALSNNQDILLESIKWHEKSSHNGIPFEMLWNVQTWNANPNLPKFVNYDPSIHRQWNKRTTAFSGTCPTVIAWFQAPHRTSLFTEVKEMTLPHPAGGARSGQPGNLWDYYRSRDKYGLDVTKQGTTLVEIEEWILTSMQPSAVVQQLVDSLKPTTSSSYIALHPRIEPEMLDHTHCQDDKVRKLQDILDQVTNYPDFAEYPELFIAVAMPQMMATPKKSSSRKWMTDHLQNVEILKTIFKDGITKAQGENNGSRHLHVWTAGESSLQKQNVNSCMLTILASIVNMELAIQANVFVGTAVSTWSTSVWKVRHYRGLPNYEFTPTGIRKVEGLPAPFKC